MASKLLFLAGSARKDSVNKKLAKVASEISDSMTALPTFIDLADFDMPIYNQDIEDLTGLPENAKKLKKLFVEHDGFCLVCPEYNGTFTPLLKNALDWISRKEPSDSAPLLAYKGKTCLLLSASPGPLGGLRGLMDTRKMLSSIGVHVIPDQLAVGGAYNKFDKDGHLTDEDEKNKLTSVVEAFVKTSNALKK